MRLIVIIIVIIGGFLIGDLPTRNRMAHVVRYCTFVPLYGQIPRCYCKREQMQKYNEKLE